MESFKDIVLRIGRTDKESCHGYAQWYDTWFLSLRDQPVNILEVGVCVFGGGSVLALAEYFQRGVIWAIDIDCKPCCPEVKEHPRINLIEADAYVAAYRLLGNTDFDVVIDDALHDAPLQMHLLRELRQNVRGFYVIEDCCTQHWLPLLKETWRIGLRHTLIDQSTPTTYDNCLIRFDKR